MLYHIYKLNDDGSKDHLSSTNNKDMAEDMKAYQETLLDTPVIIETEE